MDENKDILSNWKKRRRPVIPNGFFDRFIEELMQRIESESGVLSQLQKTEKPDVPEGFFDKLLDGITSESNGFELDELKKKELATLPTNYFENSAETIMTLVSEEEHSETNKGGRIVPLRIATAIAAIAAVIAVVFMVVDFKSRGDHFAGNEYPDLTDTITITTEENFDTYLTYLDESEIIDYIIENDIEIEDTLDQYDEYLDYSEDDLDEFYLDDIEFL